MKTLLIICALAAGASAQCGPPDYLCGAGVNTNAVKAVSSTVPNVGTAAGAVVYDTTFIQSPLPGAQIVKCTGVGTSASFPDQSFFIGDGGSGDVQDIGKVGADGTYRLSISSGFFTYTPNYFNPTCVPTFTGGFDAFSLYGGVEFSWVTPHLAYYFGNYATTDSYKVKSWDITGPTAPTSPVATIANFQHALPGGDSAPPDWTANTATPFGTIIKPLTHNAGGYLFEATCPPNTPTCSSGATAGSYPTTWNQSETADTTDNTVTWRNVGVGFAADPDQYDEEGGLSTDDNVFTKGFNADNYQDGTGSMWLAAYNKALNTYYTWNTITGIVDYFTCSGGTGPNCAGGAFARTILGMTAAPQRFDFHNVKVNKAGTYATAIIGGSGCLGSSCSIVTADNYAWFWNLSTTCNPATYNQTTSCVNFQIDHGFGHWTNGFTLWANESATSSANLYGHLYAQPTSGNDVLLNTDVCVSGCVTPNGVESHPSWNADVSTDDRVVCSSATGVDFPYVAAREAEAFCYGTSSSGSCGTAGNPPCATGTKRFFHTYATATGDPNVNFNSVYAIGSLSQDGKFYAITSDWGATLGNINNGGQCRGGFNLQSNGHVYAIGDRFRPDNVAIYSNPNHEAYQVIASGSTSTPPSWPNGIFPQDWYAGAAVSAGTYVLPVSSSVNPCFHLFSWSGGTTGGAEPNFQTAYGSPATCGSETTGGTVTDNGNTWTDKGVACLPIGSPGVSCGGMQFKNLGGDNCRSDVFVGTLGVLPTGIAPLGVLLLGELR